MKVKNIYMKSHDDDEQESANDDIYDLPKD